MKYSRKVFLNILLLGIFVCMLCSCGESRDEDINSIRALPEAFIDALTELDEDAAEECSPKIDLSEWIGYSDAQKEILQHALAFAEITETGDPVFYDEDGTASMEITVSYLTLDDYYKSLDTYYMTIDEIMDSLDGYDGRKEKTIDLEFEYDDGCWYLAAMSARKICRLFDVDLAGRLSIVDYSDKDARDLLVAYLREIADCRDASSMPDDINLDEYRYYDDALHANCTDKTYDAVARFVAAYMDYVLDHDYELVGDYPYSYELYGSAPSYTDLMEALTTDDYYIQYHANLIRYADLGMPFDEMIDRQTALIYYTLAEAIPQCEPENYSLYGAVSPFNNDTYEVYLYGDLVNSQYNIDNSYEMTEDDYYRYVFSAIELLYDNGEVDSEQYESLMDSVVSSEEAFKTDVSVSSSGHENQAVGTYEYVPPWDDADDPVIIYATSDVDDNGVWMFYSKQPGWLHTSGYCIDEEGIWIANYFDRLLYPGNEVVVDWWLDDELILDTQVLIIPSMTNEVEVFLPVDELPAHFYYEMRLWESDHSHVLAYVTLTR